MPENIKVNLLGSARASTQPTDLSYFENTGQDNQPALLRQPKKKKRSLRKMLISFCLVVVIVIAVFASSSAFSGESLLKNFANLGFLGQVGNLIVSGDRQLQGESNDRVNFLLMGIGGGNHDGANLTDTMIVASFKPSTNQVAMMSIPRDLYVKDPGYGWVKINAVNAYAEQKEKGSGGAATAKFVGDLLNTNIDYYATIDFDGFEKLIDEFGGIDVVVDNNLIDYSYPIIGQESNPVYSARYMTLNIKKGPNHFDGKTALAYARSRHALGAEGSDFARSKRQQKVLLALKDKIMGYNFLLNPNKITALMNSYKQNVSTNLQLWEMLKLLKLGKTVDYEHPITYSLTDGAQPMLYDQIVNSAYVLLPYGGNYDKIKYVWDNIFTVGTSTLNIDRTKWSEFKDQPTTTKATSTPVKPIATSSAATALNPVDDTAASQTVQPEPELTYRDDHARIQILNGTAIEGWSSKESARLKAKGFTISGIGNAPTRSYKSIKIYDFSGGLYSLTISELQVIYGVMATPPPAGLSSSADILIILGQ